MCTKKHFIENVSSGISHNGPELEATQMSIGSKWKNFGKFMQWTSL